MAALPLYAISYEEVSAGVICHIIYSESRRPWPAFTAAHPCNESQKMLLEILNCDWSESPFDEARQQACNSLPADGTTMLTRQQATSMQLLAGGCYNDVRTCYDSIMLRCLPSPLVACHICTQASPEVAASELLIPRLCCCSIALALSVSIIHCQPRHWSADVSFVSIFF